MFIFSHIGVGMDGKVVCVISVRLFQAAYMVHVPSNGNAHVLEHGAAGFVIKVYLILSLTYSILITYITYINSHIVKLSYVNLLPKLNLRLNFVVYNVHWQMPMV